MPYEVKDDMIDVQKERCRLEREVDDIIWEHGVLDPRVDRLFNEIKHYKKLEEEGVVYEPKF
mgnify:CR=1 FL=1